MIDIGTDQDTVNLENRRRVRGLGFRNITMANKMRVMPNVF